MSIEIVRREKKLDSGSLAIIIDISGDLDFEGEEMLASFVSEFVALKGANVALNLEKLNFTNSTGIAVIRKFCAVVMKNGGKLVAYAPNSMVEMVIKLTKADLFIKIFPTESEALKNLA
ncbi:MAG: STAS domain-containing protein [Candidatus Wallbacteria bacterium]|nr:STAS domain-containing protein [Candidatus Wallbacteria bacterium]